MNGEIISIQRIIDECNNILGYEIVIETKEIPNLKIGKCEVKQ